MSISIKGGLSVNVEDVDSNNNLKSNTSIVLSASGYVVSTIEPDNGITTGVYFRKTSDVSQNYRLRVGIDKLIFQDTFNHGVLNNAKYLASATTQTITVANGYLNLNANNTVAAPGPVSLINTFRTFPIFNQYPIYFDVQAMFSAPLQNNNIIEFGLGYATSTNGPVDGIFFRASAGTLNAVVNYNGFETVATNVFVPSSGVCYHYLITVGQNYCEFWVDDILKANLKISSGSSCQSNSLPILLRNYNTGGTVPTAIQLNIAQMAVTLGDMDSGKDWATLMATNGQSSINSPDGQAGYTTGTSTSNFASNAAPTTAVGTNTTAAYDTLGGAFALNASAGTEIDYMIFDYLNPVGSAIIPGKTLIITGLKIDSCSVGATGGVTPTLLQWTIGVGSTTGLLTEVDSITSGTRAPRRLNLGTQSIAGSAAIGANCDRNIDCVFSTPLMVEAGTHCSIILKVPVGLATASQIIRGFVEINGYFE
jgi:hypothetical protein